ncbi:hypothetical protein ElyMa_006031500 [Elysia marginata]|uniref:Uncharacterized protein n=1 Tax=Elysia marginata TaxID=1093978 RepID=A0AAV4GJV7_9GAST|nr:hypothetical protein ElyMa_006031500 [Elysia marginata]
MWEPEPESDQETLHLDEVKDAVDFMWEGLDDIGDGKSKRKKVKIEKTKKGQLLLKGFGAIHDVQWKDRKPAAALMLMHKDLKHGVLKFFRYKIVDKNSEAGAFGLSEQFGSWLAYMMVGENDVLISTTKSWKAVFYHLIDVAWLSSYLMFEQYRTESEQASKPHMKKKSSFDAVSFMTDLMIELAALPSAK